MQFESFNWPLFLAAFIVFLILFTIINYRRGILWFQQQDRDAELAGS